MTQQLKTTRLLYVLFYNWRSTDYENLLADAPNKKIKEDIEYVWKEKLEPTKTKFGFNLSNALMSDFFMKLNDDTAEYVLQYANEKNKNMYC